MRTTWAGTAGLDNTMEERTTVASKKPIHIILYNPTRKSRPYASPATQPVDV